MFANDAPMLSGNAWMMILPSIASGDWSALSWLSVSSTIVAADGAHRDGVQRLLDPAEQRLLVLEAGRRHQREVRHQRDAQREQQVARAGGVAQPPHLHRVEQRDAEQEGAGERPYEAAQLLAPGV